MIELQPAIVKISSENNGCVPTNLVEYQNVPQHMFVYTS